MLAPCPLGNTSYVLPDIAMRTNIRHKIVRHANTQTLETSEYTDDGCEQMPRPQYMACDNYALRMADAALKNRSRKKYRDKLS